MTLLEVLAALVLVGTAAIALVGLQAAGARSLAVAGERERILADQERLLAAYTLLGRVDLDRRLGRRHVGRYWVAVQRPEPTLYRISVAMDDAPAIEELVSVVHRAEPVARPAP